MNIKIKPKKIKITIQQDPNGTYIALFDKCGGGTHGRSINELMDNCKEVLWLLMEYHYPIKKKVKK